MGARRRAQVREHVSPPVTARRRRQHRDAQPSGRASAKMPTMLRRDLGSGQRTALPACCTRPFPQQQPASVRKARSCVVSSPHPPRVHSCKATQLIPCREGVEPFGWAPAGFRGCGVSSAASPGARAAQAPPFTALIEPSERSFSEFAGFRAPEHPAVPVSCNGRSISNAEGIAGWTRSLEEH